MHKVDSGNTGTTGCASLYGSGIRIPKYSTLFAMYKFPYIGRQPNTFKT